MIFPRSPCSRSVFRSYSRISSSSYPLPPLASHVSAISFPSTSTPQNFVTTCTIQYIQDKSAHGTYVDRQFTRGPEFFCAASLFFKLQKFGSRSMAQLGYPGKDDSFPPVRVPIDAKDSEMRFKVCAVDWTMGSGNERNPERKHLGL